MLHADVTCYLSFMKNKNNPQIKIYKKHFKNLKEGLGKRLISTNTEFFNIKVIKVTFFPEIVKYR